MMKKRRNKTSRPLISNRWLYMGLAALGFTACGSSSEDDPGVCMYGVPSVDYQVVGQVTDEAGAPIPGLHVQLDTGYDLLYTQDGQEKSGLIDMQTDAEGRFESEKFNAVGIDRQKLYIEDVDGPANGGEFEPAEIAASQMERQLLTNGEGWYAGYLRLIANIRLKLKKQ